MYRLKNQKPKKIVYIVALVSVLVLSFAAYATYMIRDQSKADKAAVETIRYDKATPQEKQEAEDIKLESPADSNKTTPAAEAEDKRIAITSATQDSSSKDIVVQTKLTGVGWRSCTLTLTKGSLLIVKNADVLFQRDFSTCMGFAIESSELPESGAWNIRLQAESSDGSTETVDQNINLIK